MDECRTSRSLADPPCLLVFWREDILDLSMIEANAQFISTNASNLNSSPLRKLTKSGRFLFTQKLLARVPNLK